MMRFRSYLAAVSTLLLFAVATHAETPFDGHWVGGIELPTGVLELDIDLESDAEGTLSGDISIPVQGIADRALEGFEVDGGTVTFSIEGIPGTPTFEGTLSSDGATLAGPFRQGGGELTFSLTRGDDKAAVARVALEGIDAVIEQAIDDFNVPGLGLAVVADGEVVLSRGFGLRNIEDELPMTEDTLFAIGSTTKAMTATVLGMLADEGKLDWDTPLVRYLPEFRLADEMITARITPRDLVTHRSGMPRHDLLWYNNNDGTRAEMIERLEHLELTADLRERFQYNNLMYMTAGYLAGRLEGATWEETVRQRLFEPLGMTRSNFSVEASSRDDDFATPYRENDEDVLQPIPFRRLDLAGPAGSVNSSVDEMTHWLRFNLAGGKIGGKQLIQTATLADIHSPHMSVPPLPPDARVSQTSYGMGWGVEIYRGHRRVRHAGGIDGFVTQVMLFPDDQVGIVAFTNRGSGLSGLVAHTVADRILGLDAVDWLGEALVAMREGEAQAEAAEAKKDAIRVEGTRPSRALDAYTGTFHHPGYGTIEVVLEDDRLAATYNDLTTSLSHWHYDVFKGGKGETHAVFELMTFQFRGDVDGQIAELVVPLEFTASPIVFDKQPDSDLTDPEHLATLTGTYRGETGQDGRFELSGTTLTLHLPGQPVYTLVPQASGRFGIEGLQGFSIGFEVGDDGSVEKVTYYQPNGVFEATRVED